MCAVKMQQDDFVAALLLMGFTAHPGHSDVWYSDELYVSGRRWPKWVHLKLPGGAKLLGHSRTYEGLLAIILENMQHE